MNDRPLTPAEKALIEREFIYEQAELLKKRRNCTRIFIFGVICALVSAFSVYVGGLIWLSFLARAIWALSIAAFLIYLGSPLPYSRFSGSVTNPWRESLSEIREPTQAIQAAILLGAFPILRLFIGMLILSAK